MAVIQGRDHHGNHFPLDAAQRPGPVHEITVEFKMAFHNAAVHTVDAQNIIGIVHPIFRGNFFRIEIVNVRHGFVSLSLK